MINQGVLVPDDFDELGTVLLRTKLSRYGTDFLSMTIAPTMACNMDCPYCFEQKSGKRMSENIQQKIIDYVNNNIKGKKQIHVAWYGGEPLLEIDIIKFLSKEIIKICEENEVGYSATIITNGYLLDADIAKVLKEECHVVFAQVTIDGFEEAHDKRRRLRNGEPSFHKIINNINLARNFINISVRINVDKNNSNGVKKLLDFFVNEMKWGGERNIHFYLAPVRNLSVNGDSNLCYSFIDFADFYNDILDFLFNNNNYISLARNLPTPRNTSCGGLCIGSLVVDPEGDLYRCWERIGIKQYVVGNITTGQYINAENTKWLLLDIPGECTECNLLPICQAGCPLTRWKENKKNCAYNSITYKKVLQLIYATYRSHPDLFMKGDSPNEKSNE